MALRAVLGFAALVAFVALGAWINRQRASGAPVVRQLAGRVHWAVGVMALGVLALLVATAVGVLAD